MEIIKLGDRLIVPGKNVKGEVAYIGKTHFGDGIWFGLILDDPVGKHNGTVENKLYFKCPKNHGMFINANFFERECGDINIAVEKSHCSSPKSIKHLNYSKNTLHASKYLPKRKIELESETKSNYSVGDNGTNINVHNNELTRITESGDNHDFSGEKQYEYIRRYPNYLKSSSHIAKSHFCLNKCKVEKLDDPAAHISNRYLIPPLRKRKNDLENGENESPKKITYPNYLKSSAKLVGKHFCIAKNSGINNYEMNKSPENTEETPNSKVISNTNDPYAYLIKFPYQRRIMSKFKEKYSYQARRIKMIAAKSTLENEHLETRKNSYRKYIRDIKSQLEGLKQENEYLKDKIQSTEASLEDALKKNNEMLKENKHLKCDNEWKRKQLKLQKSQLKLLTAIHGKSLKNSNEKWNEKSISEKFKSNVIECRYNTSVSKRQTELKNNCDTTSEKRVEELEQENRLMIQGLVELNAFLHTLSRPQSIELESLKLNRCGRHHISRIKKRTFSKSVHLTKILNPEFNAAQKSNVKSKMYSAMMQEMTKCNELTKEKGENLSDWKAMNLSKEIDVFQNSDFHDTNYQQQSLSVSGFDENNRNCNNLEVRIKPDIFKSSPTLLEKFSDIQMNYDTPFDPNLDQSHSITKMNENIDHYMADNVSFESTSNLSDQTLTKDLFYDGEFSLSNATLIEEEMEECVEGYDSRNVQKCPDFPLNSPCTTQ